jgi:hypothetical protein
MNSPPHHYPYHHFHDPTIINVHTLLKPQSYQYPSVSNTQSSPFASYTPFYQQPHNITTPHCLDAEISNSTSTFTSSVTPSSITSSHISPTPFSQQQPTNNVYLEPTQQPTPPISTIEIGSLINQLLQSQEKFKHTLSIFANEVSLLKTTLTPTFNHHQPRQELIHTINPFTQHHPPFLSFNNTHVCPNLPSITKQTSFTPSCFNHTNTHKEENFLWVSHTSSHHHHTPFSIPTEMSETTIVTNKTPTTNKEIIPTIVHEHEFAVTTELVELKINDRDEPDEIVVDDDDGDFTFLVVDSVLRVDHEEKKYVLVEEQKRHVTEHLKNSVIVTTMPSTEKEVVLSVTVAETTQQHPFFIFQLPDFPIELLDPGGSTTAFFLNPQDFVVFDPGGDEHRVCSLKAKFGNDVYVFDPGGDDRIFGSPVLISINHDTPSLLQIPWDRGKTIVYDFVISFKLFNWFTPV